MRDSLIKVDINNTAALKKLSDIGELYIAVWNYTRAEKLDAVYEKFLDPQKAVFYGRTESLIGFKAIGPDGKPNAYIFTYDSFSGKYPKLAFAVNKFWKEIFTDL